MRISDWSSDVCSSDLVTLAAGDVTRAISVAALRREAARTIREWRRPHTEPPPTAPDTTLLILRVLQKRDRRYGLKLAQMARYSERSGVAVVLALVSPDASQWWAARLLATIRPDIRVVHHPARADWPSIVGRWL